MSSKINSMITRTITQDIEWIDVDSRIYSEVTVVEYRFLGLLIRTNRLTAAHVIVEEGKKGKIGFGN